MALKDLKKKRSNEVKEYKPPMYPSMSFDFNQLPDLKKYDVGDKVHLTIVGKISRKSQEEGEPGSITVECQRADVKRKVA